MIDGGALDRRTVLRSSLLVLCTSFGAGCAGTGGSGGDGTQADTSTATRSTTATATSTRTTTGTGTRTRTRAGTGTATTSGDTGTGSNTIVLGGEVSGWTGQAPVDIDGTVNPTLSLQPGTTYVLTWANLDGRKHDLVIEDSNGNELRSTRPSSGRGATRSLTFRATPEMARYYCTFHPQSMRGAIDVGGENAGTGTTATGTGTGTRTGTGTTSAGTGTGTETTTT